MAEAMAPDRIGRVFVGDVFSKAVWVEGREFLFRGGAARENGREAWVRIGPAARRARLKEMLARVVRDGVPEGDARREFGKIEGWR